VLAKGDGSFQITKFALGDTEIDYTLYNPTHASGSAYYDIEILQTPVLEAFTNNASSMKSKLVSYESLTLLYLPVIKLNTLNAETQLHSAGAFLVCCDAETEGNSDGSNANSIGVVGGVNVPGIIFGSSLQGSNHIKLDQGIDSTAVSPKQSLDQDLVEDMYSIEIDNRLGSIATFAGDRVPHDFIDDDNIATYTVDLGLVSPITSDKNSDLETIAGPRGTSLTFKVAASIDLNTSTYLFTQLGGTTTVGSQSVRYIDSIVRVTGMKTGYSIEVPIRFVKSII
jgi:hypothetical protein